jgi:hypothetical protein
MVYCFHVFYWKMLYVDSSREWGDEQKGNTKIDRSTPISKYLTFSILILITCIIKTIFFI